jgi:enoyl-CoA hydratase
MSSDIPNPRTASRELRGSGSLVDRSSKLVANPEFTLTPHANVLLLTLRSGDGMNRLTREKVAAINAEVQDLASHEPAPLIITGERNFSAGADLNEIRLLSGPVALDFARLGQSLMNTIANFPAPVVAAISGHCMGGGLDLALACHRRIAAPHAIFGHRGAALGLITGWGGTQRLPRLIGKARALELFVAAEKVSGTRALEIGLVDSLAEDPVAEAFRHLQRS